MNEAYRNPDATAKADAVPIRHLTERAGIRAIEYLLDTGECLFCSNVQRSGPEGHEAHCTFWKRSEDDLRQAIGRNAPEGARWESVPSFHRIPCSHSPTCGVAVWALVVGTTVQAYACQHHYEAWQ